MQINMSKKTKIILGIITVLILIGGGAIILFDKGDENNNAPTDSRLEDPNLLYASFWWAGLCSNEKHESGGCYAQAYLYSDGKFIKISGFVKYNENDLKIEPPPIETKLEADIIIQITKIIKDSGIMTNNCFPQTIMDVGWDYQINLDGVKKSFHNPPEECKNIFDEIDNIINSVK